MTRDGESATVEKCPHLRPEGHYCPHCMVRVGEVVVCWCCRGVVIERDPDPWDGRLDGYCDACATNRCDAYPGTCPQPSTDSRPEDGEGG